MRNTWQTIANEEELQFIAYNGFQLRSCQLFEEGFIKSRAMTILGQACSDGDTTVVKYLLTHHTAEIDIDDKDNNLLYTAIQRAAFKGHTDIVRILCEHGCNVNTVGLSWIYPSALGSTEYS